jgi:release factor glutamine methyltransferase
VTRRQALTHAGELLDRHNIEDASLEAELLLRHTLKIDRAALYTEPDRLLTKRQEENYRQFIERRLQGEPSAYISGHREFFGLDFYIDKNVLIPRPETELLVEQIIAHAGNYQNPVIVDVGTGCGVIAVSLAVHLPQAKIYAIDISPAALKVARRNSRKHNVQDRITFLIGDLLEPLPAPADIIVANLPYVLTADVPKVNTSGFEPMLALDGGADGLDVIKRLILQAKNKLKPDGCLLLEIGMGQSKATADLLGNIYPAAKIEIIPDLSGIQRVVWMTLAK